jgi:hypothetical protein
MAVRNPLYVSGTDLQEQSATMKTAISQRAVYQWGLGTPATNITWPASGGNLGTMSDTLYKTSLATTSATAFQTPGAIELDSTFSYSKLNEVLASTSAPADTNNRRFPLYYDGTNLQAMTMTDFFDTYINTAIGYIVDGTSTDGTFEIAANTTTMTDFTLLGQVFTDRRFGSVLNTTIGLVNTYQTSRSTINTYYAFKANSGYRYGTPSITPPVYITTAGDIQTYTTAEFDTLLAETIEYYSGNPGVAGSRIRYNLNGAGNNKGVSMLDTRRNSGTTQVLQFLQAYLDHYRSQRQVTGAAQTITTYTLKINTT